MSWARARGSARFSSWSAWGCPPPPMSPANAPRANSLSRAPTYRRNRAYPGGAQRVIAAWLRFPAVSALWTTPYGVGCSETRLCADRVAFGAYHWRRVVIPKWTTNSTRFGRSAPAGSSRRRRRRVHFNLCLAIVPQWKPHRRPKMTSGRSPTMTSEAARERISRYTPTPFRRYPQV